MPVAEGLPELAGGGLGGSHVVPEMKQPSRYHYQPLVDSNTIRLLTLAPGKPGDRLGGRLEVVDVDAAAGYEPVSYVWKEPGPPDSRYEIFIEVEGEERLLELAGGSLFAALHRFRSPDAERCVWADQVCINQDDKIERSQQVQFMNKIYKNADRVLVWLGLDPRNEAKAAFDLLRQLDKKLHHEGDRKKFDLQIAQMVDKQSVEEWKPLDHLTNRMWFKRGWVVQEIGTKAAATMFWGEAEIDWLVMHGVCESLTNYHHLRKKYNVRTSDIKYLFQRFVEPDAASYHANRFNFLYELHRARGLQFTDQRDRVFAFLGHYALCSLPCADNEPLAIKADYTKTIEQVYIDLAKRSLLSSQGDSALIALAAVQHVTLPSLSSTGKLVLDKDRLSTWVPDWRTYQGFILSEPINPHRAHGSSQPELEFAENDTMLRIHGLEIDTVEACSRLLVDQDFHVKQHTANSQLPVEYLWRDICQKDAFNVDEKFVNGHSAFLAFMQTLSNGCVQIAGREAKPYHEIPEARWLEQATLYLTKALGSRASDAMSPELIEQGREAEHGHKKEEWSRSANGASKNRKFARTKDGYYVLGPAVMEMDDVLCVLFGGKMPFCLRKVGNRYLFVGECYAYGLMNGEAMDMMAKGKLTENVFEVI